MVVSRISYVMEFDDTRAVFLEQVIAFLSLSNFALVRPRGLLFEKSPRGRISEIYTRRTSVSSSFSTRSRTLLKMTSGSEMGLMSLPPMERKT